MSDDGDRLDRLLAEARDEPRGWTPGDDLAARIVADAAAQMPRRAARPAPRFGAVLLAALGGWAAVGGLAAATVAGIWIGVSPPAAVDGLLGGEELTVSIYPEIGLLDGEG